MNGSPNKTNPRRGFNMKLILFVSILISLVVRQVFGMATISTVVIPLEATNDQYRMEITLQQDRTSTFRILKRQQALTPLSYHPNFSNYEPIQLEDNYIERSLAEGLELKDQVDAANNRTITASFNGKGFVAFRVAPHGLVNTGLRNFPLIYGAQTLLPYSDANPLSFYIESNHVKGLALFGRSFERYLKFEEIISLALRTGATVKTPAHPDGRITINSFLLDVKNDIRKNEEPSATRLPSKAFIADLLSDTSFLTTAYLPYLYEKLKNNQVRYIELTTPNALSMTWLRAFQKAASALEVETGITVRLVAEINSEENPSLIEQLTELERSIKGQPYLIGFSLQGDSSSQARQIVERMKQKQRLQLFIYDGENYGPTELHSSSPQKLGALQHIQYAGYSFDLAAKNIPYNEEKPEGLKTLLAREQTTVGDPCQRMITGTYKGSFEIESINHLMKPDENAVQF